MSLSTLGNLIRLINRFCLVIGGFLVLVTVGKVLVDGRFWAFMAFPWVGLLVEWSVAELQQTMATNMLQQEARIVAELRQAIITKQEQPETATNEPPFRLGPDGGIVARDEKP